MAQIKLNATYGLTGALPAVSGANLTTLNATNISSGTLNAARYSGTDLQPIKSDISALALREATNEASAAFNLPNQFIDTFTDDTNLGTQTDGDRLSGFWATAYSLSYRYWEIYKTSSAAPGGYHRELEVYLNDVQQTITSGMLSQNDLQAWAPANLVDGSTSTNAFHTDTADAGAYMRIDFGSGNEKALDKWRFYVDAPINVTWDIKYSTDASSWTDAVTGWVTDQDTGTYQWKEQTFTAPSEESATGTLIQSANTVASAKTKVGGTMLYKDNEGTATLGTDLIIYFTCDNSNWTEAASYNAITPVYSTGIKQVRLGETTCTSGTDVRYKAVWANQALGSKETQLHGIGVNY